MARIAQSLAVLRDQINALSPSRRKSSDGWIGDPAHAKRKSEHNPDRHGVVRALDITHDPARGVDAGRIADNLRRSKDARILYVISNGRIASPPSWTWRKYTGSNAHTLHFHISVVAAPARYDDVRPWAIHPESDAALERPVLKRGSTNSHAVQELQRLLEVTVDGDFGPETEAAVKEVQAEYELTVDGIVGPYTWEAITDE